MYLFEYFGFNKEAIWIWLDLQVIFSRVVFVSVS